MFWFSHLSVVIFVSLISSSQTQDLWHDLVLQSILKCSSFQSSYEYTTASACHLLVHGPVDAVTAHFHRLQTSYAELYLSKIVYSTDFRNNSRIKNYMKRSPICFNAVVLATPSGDKLEHWIKNLIEGINFRPEQIQFVFMGPSALLRDLWTHRAIDALNFKIGLVSDSNEVMFPSPEFRVDSATATIVGDPAKKQNYRTRYVKGVVMRVGIFKLEPHIINSPEGQPLMGTSYNMLRDAASYYNYTNQIHQELKGFGQWPNGTWQGFTGDLVEHRKDMLCIFAHSVNRHKVIDHTSYVYLTKLFFYTSHPTARLSWKSIFYPFDLVTWACTLLVLLVSILTIYLHLRLRLRVARAFSPKGIVHNQRLDSLWSAVSVPYALLLQESMKIPNMAQAVGVLFAFTALILSTCYSSNLITCLTFPEPDPFPRTFRDLAKMRKAYNITLMSFKGGAADAYMQGTKDTAIVKIREKMINVPVPADCLTLAAVEVRTVCIAYRFLAIPISARYVSIHSQWNSMTESRDSSGFITPVIGLQRYSKYYSFWNFVVASFRETGHFSQWEKTVAAYLKRLGTIWMTQRAVSTNSTVPGVLRQRMREQMESDVKPFRIEHVLVAFAVIAVGCTLSVVSFLFEVRIMYMLKIIPDVSL